MNYSSRAGKSFVKLTICKIYDVWRVSLFVYPKGSELLMCYCVCIPNEGNAVIPKREETVEICQGDGKERMKVNAEI